LSTPRTQIKKVKPFPFTAQFTSGEMAFTGQILKMSQVGFLAEVASASVRVGEKVDVQFKLPVLHHEISTTGLIIKIYNQLTGGIGASGAKNIVVTEVHFKAMSETSKAHITEFLKAASKH
jgi:hypothetical protein